MARLLPPSGRRLIARDERFAVRVRWHRSRDRGSAAGAAGAVCRFRLLLLEISEHAFAPRPRAEPGFAVAAEAAGGVELVGAIHPHHAALILGARSSATLMFSLQMLRPGHSACCWKAARLRPACENSSPLGPGRKFLPAPLWTPLDISKQRRRIETTRRATRFRLEQVRAFRHAAFHQRVDTGALVHRDDGADVRDFIERIADAQRFHHARAAWRELPATLSCTRSREPAQQTCPG